MYKYKLYVSFSRRENVKKTETISEEKSEKSLRPRSEKRGNQGCKSSPRSLSTYTRAYSAHTRAT